MPQTRQSDANHETEGPDLKELMKIIAQQQTVLNSIVQTMQQQQQTTSSSSTTPPQPTTHTPAFKSLPAPKLASPDNLSIPQFRDWKQRWMDYEKATQLQQQPLDTQQGILRSALDSEWTMLWNSGRLQITSTSSLIAAVTTMETYLRKRRNPLLDRQEFHRRDQMQGESVDRYYSALKMLDDACAHDHDFKCVTCDQDCSTKCGSCTADFPLNQHLQSIRVRDRLICGLQSKEMQRKVLSEQTDQPLTLERVLSICTAMENSVKTEETLSTPSTTQSHVHVAKKSTYKKQQQSKKSETCYCCGLSPSHKRELCPAKDQECGHCKKKGHYAKVCRTKAKENGTSSSQTKKNSSRPYSSSTQQNRTNMISISAVSARKSLVVMTTIGSLQFPIKWIPDSGSDVDAISLQFLVGLGISKDQINQEKEDAIAADGKSLGPVGSVNAHLSLNGKLYHTKIRVYERCSSPLLGITGLKALGLLDQDWPLSRLNGASSSPHSFSISSGSREYVSSHKSSFSSSQLEEIKTTLMKEFSEVFDDSVLRPMDGPPMKIETVEGAIPTKRFKAHTVPYHWRDPVKQQLDEMVRKEIIEPVPVGEPVDWCHPMVVVAKKGSSEPRITIDLTGLNKYVRRPAYPVKVPREVVARIPPGKRHFTTLDGRHGYWQVLLDEESKKLTTFITPWGCYRYRRNVMGLISAGDEHNRRGDEALQGIECVEKIVEDTLVYDDDMEAHISRVREVLQRCKENCITLNAKKFVFAQPEVDWCGFRLNENGYTPSPHLFSALTNFPPPTSRTDIRSFCGLVQQFEAFSHRITELSLPIRSLLSASSAFVWEATQQKAFEEIINELTSPRVLTHFEPNRPLRLETDAAQSKGLGFALWQQQPDQLWKLLQAGSRFATPTESRYSATEIEMLAVVWAIKKCRLFLLGKDFELIVDHRPLISIINSKTLDEVDNPRLQRMKEKLSSYRPKAVWRAGVKHTVVDVFSRFPTSDPDEEDLKHELDSDPVQLFALSLQDNEDGSRILPDPLIVKIKEQVSTDPVYDHLRNLIAKGFPVKAKLDVHFHPYWKIRDSLSVEDTLIYKGAQVLIPESLRSDVLSHLHSSHQGQDRTLRRARQTVFWPGMTNEIRNLVRSCKECASYLPSQQKEPMMRDPEPSYPFQSVGTDLFAFAGYEFLVMVDKFSGWLSIAKCGRSATTANVIFYLKKWMVDLGIPEQLKSDNGPQFSSFEFQNFTKKWNINHTPSSPHYPQSNGLAEAAVKALKHLLAKSSPNGDIESEEFQLGLLELRNTPRQDGRSPAQLLFGSPIRSTLPFHRSRFAQEWKKKSQDADVRAMKIREKARAHYDASSRPLSSLQRGDIVLVQDHRSKQWDLLAEITDVKYRGRSYTVKTESGRLLRRNRRFLRPFSSAAHQEQPQDAHQGQTLRRSTRERNPKFRM